MSLEDALNRHADAITLLAESLIRGVTALSGLKAAIPTVPAAPAEKAAEGLAPAAAAAPVAGRGRRPAAAPAANPAAAAAPGLPPAAAAAAPLTAGAAAAPAPAGIKYEDIRVAFTKLGELKGSQAAIALLAKFGVKNGKEIPAARYPEFAAAIKAELPPEVAAGLPLFK